MGSDEAQREALRRFLSRHQPIDEQERLSVAAFIEQLDRLDRPFAEDGGPIHVTSSAVVVGARGVILHKHKRLGIWIQPGGHIDEDERPEDAALREVLEETGLTTTHFSESPTIIHIDVHPAPKGHTHLDLRYVLRGPDAEPEPPEGESPDVAWFSFEDARSVAHLSLAGLLTALQRFYERHGFIEIERTDGSGNEEQAPDVRYRWSGVADRRPT
jgi:8-oxo-dGTP pyrophosphatase MutT (NUDIX family)